MNRKEKELKARKLHVINSAAKIFARDGYENASINEIAKASEFTKRTLYKYFKDKADIYLSVLLNKYEAMVDELIGYDYKGENGLDILQKSIKKQYDYYKKHPDTFRIMYDIGNVRQITENEKIHKFLELDKKITRSLGEIIELGQEDGSISDKYDAKVTTLNLKFILASVFDKLSIVGANYSRHINKTKEEFEEGLLDMIIDIVRK